MSVLKMLNYYFLFFIAILLTPPSALAQASLQGGSLQQQTGQTQNTRNVQSETAPLQNNKVGEALNQTQPKSLEVFSSPTQAKPDAVASPSPDLRTDVRDAEQGTDWLKVIGAVSLAILALVISYWVKTRYYDIAPIAEPLPVKEKPNPKKKVEAEAPAKKTKKAAKKKRKSKRRY
jgi:hypothetical protein